MLDISQLRDEIDNIDQEIVSLFEKRMDVAVKVAKYKMERNLPIFNGKREAEVIEKNIKRLNNKQYKEYAEKFFNDLMATSRLLQHNIIGDIKIGIQGVAGSYSEEAKIAYF